MTWLELEDIEKIIAEYGNVVYKFCIKLTQNKEDGEVVLGKLIGLDKMICLSLIILISSLKIYQINKIL